MASVKDIFGVRHKKGLVGIEIEVEGHRLPMEIGSYWNREVDGSLRGESAEYVLKTPVAHGKVNKALSVLKAAYVRNDAKINNESPRTGVHVHINVQDLNMVKVFNMITLYHALEELLVRYCGEGRQGNLFCLRLKDADYLSEYYRQALRRGDWHVLRDDAIRYASLNVTALHKFGSLEFRSMRGSDDFDMIETWVNMLVKLKEAAELYPDPVAIVESLSRDGELRFLETVLGEELANEVIAPDAEDVIREGIRIIQDICYDVDWKRVEQDQGQAEEFDGLTAAELGLEEVAPEAPRFQEPPRQQGANPQLAAYWRQLRMESRAEVRELAARKYGGDVVAALIEFKEQRNGENND